MKIVTILGTRPEIIRLSLIIQKLDQFADRHILVHTGQNYKFSLSEVFFEELNIRRPDYILHDGKQSLGEQLGTMFVELERIFQKEKPDKALVLGDTNSALSAILAERMNIPVYHLEAGNRCFDLKVPEEKNRRIIDAVSTFNLPYTENSRKNLEREGFPGYRIMVSGNPIYEVLGHYEAKISNSDILRHLNIQGNDYFLVTAHRAENVDDPKRLEEIVKGLHYVAEQFGKPVICSIHPRTKLRISSNSTLVKHPQVQFHEPFGFFDFIQLEKQALCVLTDSGTVQEECCLFHVPTVTFRETTERPETVECGSNAISGVNAVRIKESVATMVRQSKEWAFPEGYAVPNVSDKVVKYLLGGIRIV